MRKIFIILMSVLLLCSCDNFLIETTYSCSVIGIEMSDDDVQTVKDYIVRQGGPIGSVTVGPNFSESINDKEIRIAFEQVLKNTDFNSLNLPAGSSFEYAVKSVSATICSFSWPEVSAEGFDNFAD